MYYSISEVSKRLNVSKVTIYKKLAKINELKQYIKSSKEGKLISEEGLEVIRKSLLENQFTNNLRPEFTGYTGNILNDNDLSINKLLIEQFEKQIEEFKKDKESLYKQLEIKDKQIESLTRLNENSQVLLKHHQEKIQLLESHIEERPEEQTKVKSLFKRLFT